MLRRIQFIALYAIIAICAGFASQAHADGTETLGAPSITIAEGARVISEGVGLRNAQPGIIEFDIEAGETLQQLIIYWSGFNTAPGDPADATLVVNGTEVAGQLIGGVTRFFPGAWTKTFRADITSLVPATPGAVSLAVEGLDFARVNHGVGIYGIVTDAGENSFIEIRDGNDCAYGNFAFPLDSTVPQVFGFEAADEERDAEITFHVASVFGEGEENVEYRPTIIRVTIGEVAFDFLDLLNSTEDQEWDTIELGLLIPEGVTTVTAQIISEDHAGTGIVPASLVWVASSLTIDTPEAPQTPEGCPPHFWRRNLRAWGPTGTSPWTNFRTEFGCGYNISLYSSLYVFGWVKYAIFSEGTAALLNARHPEINYPMTEAEVKQLVCSAMNSRSYHEIYNAVRILRTNNRLGCEGMNHKNAWEDYLDRRNWDSYRRCYSYYRR